MYPDRNVPRSKWFRLNRPDGIGQTEKSPTQIIDGINYNIAIYLIDIFTF